MERANAQFSMGRRWFMYIIVLFLCVGTFYNMFKAPTLFLVFQEQLGFTPDNIGLLMSMFTVMGVVLAFPAGWIINRIGIKASMLITAGAFVLGAAIGAFATDANVMLVGRFIEGVGAGLGVVVAPAAITAVVPRKKLGLAMGAYGTVFPIGNVLAMNLTPAIYASFGWQAAWWAGAIISAIGFVLILFMFRLPSQESMDASGDAVTSSASKIRPDWLGIAMCAVAFGVWNFIWGGAFNFYPAFLQQDHILDIASSGFISSIPMFLMIFLAPLSGIVSDKLGTRKGLIVFCFVGTAVMFLIAFSKIMPLVYVFVVVQSIFAVCVTTGVYSLVPELARNPKTQAYGISLVTFLQNIGMLVGSAVFGPVSNALGYNMASWVTCVPLAAVMAILSAIFIKDAHKARHLKEKPREEVSKLEQAQV